MFPRALKRALVSAVILAPVFATALNPIQIENNRRGTEKWELFVGDGPNLVSYAAEHREIE